MLAVAVLDTALQLEQNGSISEAIFALEGAIQAASEEDKSAASGKPRPTPDLQLSVLQMKLNYHARLAKLYFQYTEHSDRAATHARSVIEGAISTLSSQSNFASAPVFSAFAILISVYGDAGNWKALGECLLLALKYSAQMQHFSWLCRYTINATNTYFRHQKFQEGYDAVAQCRAALNARLQNQAPDPVMRDLVACMGLFEAHLRQAGHDPGAERSLEEATETFRSTSTPQTSPLLSAYCAILNLTWSCLCGRFRHFAAWLNVLQDAITKIHAQEAAKQQSTSSSSAIGDDASFSFFEDVRWLSARTLRLIVKYFEASLARHEGDTGLALRHLAAALADVETRRKTETLDPHTDFLRFLIHVMVINLAFTQGNVYDGFVRLNVLANELESDPNIETVRSRARILHIMCSHYAAMSNNDVHSKNHLKRAYRRCLGEVHSKAFCRLQLALLRLFSKQAQNDPKELERSLRDLLKLVQDARFEETVTKEAALAALASVQSMVGTHAEAASSIAAARQMIGDADQPIGSREISIVCAVINAKLVLRAGNPPEAVQLIEAARNDNVGVKSSFASLAFDKLLMGWISTLNMAPNLQQVATATQTRLSAVESRLDQEIAKCVADEANHAKILNWGDATSKVGQVS